MAQPTDWLGQFLESEIRAAIEWQRSSLEVKPDPDGRFSDDYSNLRSAVGLSLLPPDAKAQITKVVSTEDPVTVLISDGHTQLRAQFSERAVTVLEQEIGERLDSEMRGDVIAIQQATVISTQYGPDDSFIQLAIDDLEYQFHLRKNIGQPKPVQQRVGIKLLLGEISQLRLEQYAADTGVMQAITKEPSTNAANDGTPKSQRSVEYSQPSPGSQVHQSPTSQQAIATQIPTRKKPKGPSLDRDGFEMANGANLAPPVAANAIVTSRRSGVGSHDQPTTSRVNPAALMSLLGKRKAEPQPNPQPAERERPPAPSQHHEPMQIRSSPSAAGAARDVSQRNQHGTLLEPKQEPQIRESATLSPGISRYGCKLQPPPRDYLRRKIPRDQQKLLDRRDSWLPSLPGRQFPHPNVPISLLKQWNARAPGVAKLSTDSHAKSEEAGVVVAPAIAGAEEASAQSSDSSSESTSGDEELSASQWPPSPFVPKQRLPPDSTMQSNMRRSPHKEDGLPPDSSNEAVSATLMQSIRPVNSSNEASEPTRPVSSGSVSVRTPHTLPKRPDWIPHGNQMQSARRQSSQRSDARSISSRDNVSQHSSAARSPSQRSQHDSPAQHSQQRQSQAQRPPSQHSPIQRSATKHGPIQRFPAQLSPAQRPPSQQSAAPARTSHTRPTSMESSFMKPSPKSIKRADRSPCSTSATLIKATQPGQNDGTDEMEMDVPRSLDVDPAVAHRQRRSEFFRAHQRREWIKANYTPSPSASGHFGKAYSAYKKAHPKDTVKLSDFAAAIEAAHPGVEETPSKTQADPAPLASHPPAPRTSTADTDGAVDPLEAEASEAVEPTASFFARFTGTNAERRMSGTVRVLPRAETPLSKAPRSSLGTQSAINGTKPRNAAPPTVGVSKSGSKRSVEGDSASDGRVLGEEEQKARHAEPSSKAATGKLKRTDGVAKSYTPNEKRKGDAAATTSDRVDGALNVFQDFMVSWKALKPGGAFAVMQDETRSRTNGKKRQLNILDWES